MTNEDLQQSDKGLCRVLLPEIKEVIHIYEHDQSVFRANAISPTDNAYIKRNRGKESFEQLPIDFKDLLSCRQEG